MVLFAAATLAGMVCSCDKGNDNKKKGDKEGGEEEEAAALIDIDGAFTDWDALKDVTTIECPADALYPALKKAKLAIDEKYLYAYVEYEILEGQSTVPFEIIVNADNNDESGGKEWLFKGADEATYCGYEYNIETELGFLKEGKIVNIDGTVKVYDEDDDTKLIKEYPDGSIYEFRGPDGAEGWDDLVEGYEFSEDGSYLFPISRAVMKSAGVIEEGVAKVEISVLREDMEIKVNTIKVGLIAFDDDWATAGCLPQGPASGTTIGQADMQKLDL